MTWCPLVLSSYQTKWIIVPCSSSLYQSSFCRTLLNSSQSHNFRLKSFSHNRSLHRNYYLLLVLLNGLPWTFPTPVHPYWRKGSTSARSINTQSCHRFIQQLLKLQNKEKKTTHWWFFPFIPLHQEFLVFDLLLQSCCNSQQNISTALLLRCYSGSNRYLRANFCLYNIRVVIFPLRVILYVLLANLDLD